ncbi:MAG: hypothetical protein ACRD0K_10690 [Egibacteraceae bacterium]
MTKNHVAEWYGHRVYPVVAATPAALADQRSRRCPFLSEATGQSRQCVKAATSQGVCTVSSSSNGPRQDWLVCPFRALDDKLLDDVVRRLFGYTVAEDVTLCAATVLADEARREEVREAVAGGRPVIVYFQSKLGGEITVPRTSASPELSLDATLAELLPPKGREGMRLGRYGIFEVQTMDYHGTYKEAVTALNSALDLHGSQFHQILAANAEWLSRRIEGPNIANVFKRTFYQMMFKFKIGAHGGSAGCALAIPRAVWDSWQRHLGKPELISHPDGTWRLAADTPKPSDPKPPAWIYVFDIDVSDAESPNDLMLWRVIGTDASAVAHYALDVAPQAALEEGGSVDRILIGLHRRLAEHLPEVHLA